MTTGKTIALTRQTFVGKVASLLFTMLSRLVIAFLPRSKHFNSMVAVTIRSDFGALQKNKFSHSFHCFPSICQEVMGLDAMRESLNSLYFQRLYSQVRSYSEVSGSHEFWGDSFNPVQPLLLFLQENFIAGLQNSTTANLSGMRPFLSVSTAPGLPIGARCEGSFHLLSFPTTTVSPTRAEALFGLISSKSQVTSLVSGTLEQKNNCC